MPMQTEAELERRRLRALQLHWDGVYDIGVTDDIWTARLRTDPAVILTGDGPRELSEALREDYAGRADRQSRIAESGSW